MVTKFLAVLLLSSFSLYAGLPNAKVEALHGKKPKTAFDDWGSGKSHRGKGLRHYAVFSNQVPVTSGNIPWSPATVNDNSPHITVDGNGTITLPKSGIFFVQYTVRLTKSPYDGTSTAVVQLQQTVSGVPTNITQAAVTNNVSVDEITVGVPESQTQVTGYALVNVTSKANNKINLTATITGGNLSIPAASGTDANAEIAILQMN